MHLFPLSQGTKIPPKGCSWPERSSNFPIDIAAMETEFPGCGFGVDCGASGLLVVDIDVKAGKEGLATWKRLRDQYGETPNTYCIETPSHGYHLYFRGPARNSASKLGDGLDIRGVGGYVVAAGTVIREGTYAVHTDAPIAEAPEWLINLCSARKEKSDAPAIEQVDQASLIDAAIRYLITAAEHSVQNDGGDDQAFRVACKVKDIGISESLCLQLMLDHWNEQCQPPWSAEELQTKVRNAYEFGQNQIGGGTAAAVDWEANNSPSYAEQINQAATAGNSAAANIASKPTQVFDDELSHRRAADIQLSPTRHKRKWILGYRYLRNYATAIIAPGGVGKSMLSIVDALAVCSGHGVTGEAVRERGNVWMHNAEDPIEEIELRVSAAAKEHGIALKGDDLILTSGRDHKIKLVIMQGQNAVWNHLAINAVVKKIKDHNIVLWLIDPLVRMHELDNENDNKKLDTVMDVLSYIAEETGCGIGLIHHTRKLNGADGAGDMDSSRGASALSGAARVIYTLTNMSEDQAEKFGIPEDRRSWYIQLKDAKLNMSPPVDKQVWFEKVSVDTCIGEHVGTLKPASLTAEIRTPEADKEHNVIIMLCAELFNDQQVHSLTDVTNKMWAHKTWKAVSKMSVVSLRNKMARMVNNSQEYDVEDSDLVVRFIDDKTRVPGKGAQGVEVVAGAR